MYHLYTPENLRKAAELDLFNQLPHTDMQVKLKLVSMFEDTLLASIIWGIYQTHRELGKSVLEAYEAALQAHIDAATLK